MDGAHVDLKGFDEDTCKKLNSRKLAAILGTLKTLNDLGVRFEIINLVVPTYTDNPDTIRRMCDWIVKDLGPDRPLHFSRFRPQHRLAHLTPTPVETLVKARDAARAGGLHHIYIGNVPGLEGAETTWCPNCRKAVVERDIFAVTRMDTPTANAVSAGRRLRECEDENQKSEIRSRRPDWPQHEFHRVAVAPVVNPRLPAILINNDGQPLDLISLCICGIKRESRQFFPIREHRVPAATERSPYEERRTD